MRQKLLIAKMIQSACGII